MGSDKPSVFPFSWEWLHILIGSKAIVIPAKAGIQDINDLKRTILTFEK